MMRTRAIGVAALLLASCAHARSEGSQARDATHPGEYGQAQASAARATPHGRARESARSAPERGRQAEHGSADTHGSTAQTPGEQRADATRASGASGERENAPPTSDVYGARPDNTRVNERDRERSALTPLDQSESEADRELTRRIRRAAVADSSLSFTAKNVKIITRNGQVTLRGPVNNARERATLEQIARAAAGPARVSDELEVLE